MRNEVLDVPDGFARMIVMRIRVPWRSGLLFLLTVGGSSALMSLVYVRQALPSLIEDVLEQTFPRADVEIRSARFLWPTGVALNNVIIRDLENDEVSARIERIFLLGTIQDILDRRVREIAIKNAEVRVDGADLLTMAPPKGSQPNLGWHVGSLYLDYASIDVSGLGPGMPDLSLKATLSSKDLLSGNGTFYASLWDVQVSAPGFPDAPFLQLYLVDVQATEKGIVQRAIQSADVDGGVVAIGEALKSLAKASPSDQPPGEPWTIQDLEISRLETRLSDLGRDAPDIVFHVDTRMRDITLGQARESVAKELHEISFADLSVYSPADPLTRVVHLREVNVAFSIHGILNEEIEKVVIDQPTIYLGQDLFWYMQSEEKEGKGPAWTIHELDVHRGRIVIAGVAGSDVGLPLNFETQAENVELNNLASLQLLATLEVPEQTFVFPSYQMTLNDLSGKMRFAYPPASGKKNVVHDLELAELRWRQYRAEDLWLSVTFDAKGIYGDFGGEAYGGYLKGGFAFFFLPESPWVGWLSGDRVNLSSLTNILAPENFKMTGPLDFRVQLNARKQVIDRLKGSLSLRRSGTMRITKLDELLKEIPPKWPEIKSSITKVGLETLRDFEYSSGKGDFWYVDSQGYLSLSLTGPNGTRNLETFLHADDSSQGKWKQSESR